MFQDEGRFGLLGTPRRCWAPGRIRPVVGARLERKYLYAFSAVSPHDGVMDSLILPWVNAETMSLFLTEVAQRHADEFVFMVMDQAGWHLAGDLIVPEKMRLMFLPPYSPELNPAEHLWEAIRGRMLREPRLQRPGCRRAGSCRRPPRDGKQPRPNTVHDRIRVDNFYINERELVSDSSRR